MSTATTILDSVNAAAAAAKVSPAAALQAMQVASNAQVVTAAFATLTAALDTDSLQNSDYASVAGTASIGTLVTKFNAVLARLDADTSVADTNYVALLTVSSNEQIGAKFIAQEVAGHLVAAGANAS